MRALNFSILGSIFIFAGSILLWHRFDTRPPAWDDTVHLHLALDYRELITQGRPVTTSWASVYPPLYHLSLIPALSIGTPSETKAAVFHTFYFLLLVLALVALARGMGRPAIDGLLAALLVAGFEHVFYCDRRALIDFPLMCWVTMGMALLQRTDGFQRRGMTLVWSLWSGLGLWLKFFYPIFFLLPCLYELRRHLPAPRSSTPVRNFIGAVFVIIVVAIPWYGWQGPLFFTNAVGLAGSEGAAEGDPSFLVLAGWTYYLSGLLIQLGWPSLIFTVLGCSWLALRWRESRGKGMLVAWVLSGYITFSFVHNKDWRYTLPYLPALALLAVLGWFPAADHGRSRRWFLPILGGLFLYNGLAHDAPVKQDWKHAEIGDYLVAHRDPRQPFLIASVLANHPDFFGRGLRWSMRARGQMMWTQSPDDPTATFTEYVLTKSGDLGPSAVDIEKEWSHLQASGRSFSELYPAVATFALPDGSSTTIYQRDANHVFQVGPIDRADLERRLAAILGRDVKAPIAVHIDTAAANLPRGRLDHVRVIAGPGLIRGLPFESLELDLTGVWLNLYQVWDHERLGLLACDAIEPHLTLRAGPLRDLILERGRAKDIYTSQVHFEDGDAFAEVLWKHLLASVDITVYQEDHPARVIACLRTLRLDGVPLPGWLFGKVHLQELPCDPIPSFPVTLQIHHLSIDHDSLKIND